MKKFFYGLFAMLLALSVIIVPSSPTDAATKRTEIVVSAAISLQDSLDEIAKAYESSNATIKLIFNYGASGTLQQQIEQGAPADLFFSAGKKQMDALIEKKLITKSATLLKNQLVMVVPADSKLKFTTVRELTDKAVKQVAIGQPESVPAGSYAQETLVTRKVWDALSSKLVYAKDVRQVLTYVETGNVDAGFVYRTDALSSKKVKIALKIAGDTHKPIVYPAGVLKESEHAAEAEAFYKYLSGSEARKVFVKHGFLLP